MKSDQMTMLSEIRDMLRVLVDGQEKLLHSVNVLMEEQRKLHEEVRYSNFVLNSITSRNEIIN
ncbi:MAG: hypothetical protein N2645_11655 [Clostridia bacterium]|nr:hypothetical protein [Clostridia bacterium]